MAEAEEAVAAAVVGEADRATEWLARVGIVVWRVRQAFAVCVCEMYSSRTWRCYYLLYRSMVPTCACE